METSRRCSLASAAAAPLIPAGCCLALFVCLAAHVAHSAPFHPTHPPTLRRRRRGGRTTRIRSSARPGAAELSHTHGRGGALLAPTGVQTSALPQGSDPAAPLLLTVSALRSSVPLFTPPSSLCPCPGPASPLVAARRLPSAPFLGTFGNANSFHWIGAQCKQVPSWREAAKQSGLGRGRDTNSSGVRGEASGQRAAVGQRCEQEETILCSTGRTGVSLAVHGMAWHGASRHQAGLVG